MDQPTQYSSLPRHSSSRQMFQSAQLPPPSQLHQLAPSSYSRSNTLPPIPALAPNLSSRYPPASYHPSLASASPTLPPLPSNASQLPWPTQRTSSSRDERYPPRSHESKVKPLIHDPVPPPPPSQPEPQKESEDNMPPTSDFVKKLYKYAVVPHTCSYLLRYYLGCWKILLSRGWSRGALTVTAL